MVIEIVEEYRDGVLIGTHEVVVDDRLANGRTIEDRAVAALAANRTFVGIASPTAAQIAAQVKALTRQNNSIIRVLLNRFDGTD